MIEEDIKYIKRRIDIMENNIDRIEITLNKLVDEKKPRDRSEVEKETKDALSLNDNKSVI